MSKQIVGADRLCDIFLVARAVVDQLSHERLAFPVPTVKPGGLLDVIEKQAAPNGIEKIDLIAHDSQPNFCHSVLFRFEKYAEIHYAARSSLDWRRFATCKEAMHLLLDNEDCHFTLDFRSLIENLIVGEMVAPDTPIDSEWAAEIAAIEAVLPWKLRRQLEAMRDEGFPDFEISARTKVPEKYVTAMLRGNYGKVSNQINTQLDGD